MTSKRLVVKCTWGTERRETLFQAYTVAATAAASGIDVTLWLTGDATLTVLRDAPEETLEHSPGLTELRATVLELGAIRVCSQCAKRRGLTEDALLEGVRISGVADFVASSLDDGVQALVY